MGKPLQSMTKADLIDEVRRLRGEPIPTFEQRYGLVKVNRKPVRSKPVRAGMDLMKDDLLVVDEAKMIAYVYPEVKTVAGKVRIHGYAKRSFKKGQQVKMRHWLDYDPK